MRRCWPWLLALAPAALGFVASALLQRTLERALGEPPRLYVSADVVALSWICGLALSALLLAILAVPAWLRRRDAAKLAQLHAQAAEERRRFLRRLDHELKNPITAIRAALANLASASLEYAQREALDSVETQAMRVGRLVADLRKLAELETRALERARVDVTALLEEAVGVVGDQIEALERRITLTTPQAPWPLPAVAGDRDLLFLAIYNLLDNALKFTRPSDAVEVRAFEDGRTVVVEVADTGPGIPEEEIPHVWEELYRGEGARGVPGSGLGLALTRAVIERHGGQASVRSRAGQGTVFTLRLPAA